MNKKEVYRIAILNHHASAPDVGGGGRHYDIAKLFAEKGHKITIIASSYANGTKKYNYNEEVVIKQFGDNLNFVYLKTKPAYKNIITRFVNYIDYMRKAAKFNSFKCRPNVIIASSVHPFAWVAGHKLSRRYNAKFIVEVRDLWPLSMYEDFSGIIRKIVFSLFESLERKYYNLADAIITTAPYAYEYMEEKYGIDKSKVFHIPHGLDISEFDKNTKLEDKVLDDGLRQVLDNNFCITYTGSLSKSEGLPTFVESAKYLKGINKMKLVIVGSGSEKSILETIIKEHNLDNVIMVDKQPKEFIPLILKKSDVLFCGLMEREAFKYGISKNKFYDYMASGKPIIFASSVRDSLIDKAEAGITIKPHEPEELAKAIKYLYENIDTIGKQYGQNGRRYVEKYHTNNRITQQFMDVIEFCNCKN
ncbi:MAG TPA: glycosyltransferase family 4 protein [Defluviitaleaceae bacterium]|jgi:glycosyltransferase involved in cell wall biosynthesis|nr:glycosyltransferase family 4 protein [Defluviitaleaceae bacterium]